MFHVFHICHINDRGRQAKKIKMNVKNSSKNHFDAIVIGSGISGGWAAMELCKKGLKTLVLERGRDIEHIKGYPTANLHPWEFKNGLNNTTDDYLNDPVQ